MAYSILDYDIDDQSQYFRDTYVSFNTRRGGKIGMIESFCGEGQVIIRSDGEGHVVDIEDINWKGLTRTKCISYDDRLIFIGPAGSRSYKKPPTIHNTVALIWSGEGATPRLVGAGMSRRIVPQWIEKYLAKDVYPSSEDEVHTLIREGYKALVLSPSAGISIGISFYYLIKDSVVINVTEDYRTVTNFIRKEIQNGS